MRRRALLAGAWYPDDPHACREAIDNYCRPSGEPASKLFSTLGGAIGPHAGWAYSGHALGRALALLAEARAAAELVVVFGSHRGAMGPNSVFCAEAWETPLGPIMTEQALAHEVRLKLGFELEPVVPVRPDNAVEVQLPFLRALFPRATLLMCGVAASAAATEVGRSIGERVRCSGRDAVFVGSTDLTHYGPDYGFVPAGQGKEAETWVRDDNDRAFIDAVEGDQPLRALAHAIEHKSACCPGAVVATMEAVRACHGAIRPRLVQHYLSCDVRPNRNFVGYASFVL